MSTCTRNKSFRVSSTIILILRITIILLSTHVLIILILMLRITITITTTLMLHFSMSTFSIATLYSNVSIAKAISHSHDLLILEYICM